MKLARLLIIPALLLAPVTLPAQQNSDAAQNTSQALPKEPVLQPNPLDVLRQFEGPGRSGVPSRPRRPDCHRCSGPP